MLDLLSATVMDVPVKNKNKILVLDSTATINNCLQVLFACAYVRVYT